MTSLQIQGSCSLRQQRHIALQSAFSAFRTARRMQRYREHYLHWLSHQEHTHSCRRQSARHKQSISYARLCGKLRIPGRFWIQLLLSLRVGFHRQTVSCRGFTVLVYLVQQLFAVDFGSLRNGSANGFIHVCVSLDVCPVNEYCLGWKIPCVVYLVEYPVENLLHHIFRKPVAEVIAECWEMRSFLSQRIPKEPTVRYVQADFLGSSP